MDLEIKQQLKKGFTLVELIVVLAIVAILAALIGGGLTAYVRMARFEQNEANASAIYQAAQAAMTRRSAAGTLDDWLTQAAGAGVTGAGYEGTEEEAGDLQRRVRALYYDRENPDTDSGRLVRQLLDSFVYDDSLWDASLCLEVDVLSGRVYSVFYAAGEDRLRFGAALDISDRSYAHRRSVSLVGYYGTGLVDVVSLKQIKLKVRSQQLVNGETLTMNWSGNSRRQDMDVVYELVFYGKNAGGAPSKLFSVQVDLAEQQNLGYDRTNPMAWLPVTVYSGGTQSTETCCFPLSYEGGRFTLTLDAMVSADILQRGRLPAVRSSSLFSITRFVQDPVALYATVQASPNAAGEQFYTPGKVSSPTNTENSLFASAAAAGTGTKVTVTAFRHLYNLRFVSGKAVTAEIAKNRLDWTGGSVVVYEASAGAGGGAEPHTPAPDAPVAFPAIPELEKDQTLNGKNAVIRNLQLRTESVAEMDQITQDGVTVPAYHALYAGLFGINRGAIEKLTLQNPDMAVNLTGAYAGRDAVDAAVKNASSVTGENRIAYTDEGFRRYLRGVGVLCGLNTGKLEDITLDMTGSTARAAAAVAFGDNPVSDGTLTDGTVLCEYSVEGAVNKVTLSELRGVGGVAGIVRDAVTAGSAPEQSRPCTVSGLSVTGAADSTGVVGLLVPIAPESTNRTLSDRTRYLQAGSQYLPVGIGGAAGMVAVSQAGGFSDVTGGVSVCGNGYTGGVAGGLLGIGNAQPALTGLRAEAAASVTATANWNGGILGQFFGGITGYLHRLTLDGSTSAAGAGRYSLEGLSKAQLTGELLTGDFVGGIAGYARDASLNECRTVMGHVSGGGFLTNARGFVMGRSFVGGLVGGSAADSLQMTSGTNLSHVFGTRFVGGIVAVNGGNCTVNGARSGGLVAGIGENAAYVGGIAGLNDGSWSGGSGTETPKAVLKDCSVVVWNEEIITSDQERETYYQRLRELGADSADFVGGMAGLVGAGGSIRTPKSVTVVLVGNRYVGGLAGCIAADADSCESVEAAGYVSGASCVGGVVGLSCRTLSDGLSSALREVRGSRFVGGIAGAFLSEEDFTWTGWQTTNAQGLVQGDAVVGGVVGWAAAAADLPLAQGAELTGVQGRTGQTRPALAEELAACLPGLSGDGHVLTLPEGHAPQSDVSGSMVGFQNSFTVRGGAFVGGVAGACAGCMTVQSAVNNGALQCAASVSQWQNSVLLEAQLAAWQRADAFFAGSGASGALMGGIAGMTGPDVVISSSTNNGSIYGTAGGVGGLAGLNLGTVQGGSSAAVGSTQQDFVGGAAGINAGLVSDTAAVSAVTGGSHVGGLAGISLTAGTIRTEETVSAPVSGRTRVGGIAGTNLGRLYAAAVGSRTGSTAVTGVELAGGIAGYNGGTIAALNDGATLTVAGSVSVAASGSGAGGAAGANGGFIRGVISQADVRANGDNAGGIAGSNLTGAEIENCINRPGAGREVRASRGLAGGIAGSNAGTITGGSTSGRVTAGGGLAGGITAVNTAAGKVNGTVVSADTAVSGAAEAIGLAAARNEGEAVPGGTARQGVLTGIHIYGGSLSGRAGAAGGIAGINLGAVQSCFVTIADGNTLDFSGLSAAGSTNRISAGGAVGVNAVQTVENAGTVAGVVSGVEVTGLTVTDTSGNYQHLGGVAGQNDGTLLRCVLLGGTLNGDPNGNLAASKNGDTVGGIAGKNTGIVSDCSVEGTTIDVEGSFNVDSSYSAAVKLAQSSHVGGIAGRNDGVLSGCTIGTDGSRFTQIRSRLGFVGGVAGSNSGSITGCGGLSGETVSVGDGETASVRSLMDLLSADYTAAVAWLKKYSFGELCGVDPVTRDNAAANVYAAGANRCVVALYDPAAASHANGYLGGLTGYNAPAGAIRQSATGRWFVYGDNVTLESAVGGLIGLNQSDASQQKLLNMAAVRRYYRCEAGETDDRVNQSNRMPKDKSKDGNDSYVGGIIGWQQNNTSNQWELAGVINCGQVFNSRSNNTGGIIAYWTANGGSLRECSNFGSQYSNMNTTKGDSGTAGGIVGYFNNPTSGDAVNIVSCQNWGDIDYYTNGANDVAGIVGKTQLKNAGDAMAINVIGCVNGSVTLKSLSLTCGIFGYMGPWAATLDNVTVNIDRCYNLSTELQVQRKYTGANNNAGIVGNRSDSRRTESPTTVTNCFSLWRNYGIQGNPIAFSKNRNAENLVLKDNYYMDEESFDTVKYAGLQTMLRAGGDCYTTFAGNGRAIRDVQNTRPAEDWAKELFDGDTKASGTGYDQNNAYQANNGKAKVTLVVRFPEPVSLSRAVGYSRWRYHGQGGWTWASDDGQYKYTFKAQTAEGEKSASGTDEKSASAPAGDSSPLDTKEIPLVGWNNVSELTITIENTFNGNNKDWLNITELELYDAAGQKLDLSRMLVVNTATAKSVTKNAAGGTRLYAGADLSADTDPQSGDYPFFAARPGELSISQVDAANSCIASADFADPASPRTIVSRDGNSAVNGSLMLLFRNADSTAGPSMGDITDEVLQFYYTSLLDVALPGAPANVTVRSSSEETENVYGRYEVTWDAPQNSTVKSYVVRVFLEDEADSVLEMEVYENRCTFAVNEQWLTDWPEERGRRQFRVTVAAVNERGSSDAAESGWQALARPLPTPEVCIRKEEDGWYLVLTAESVQTLQQTGTRWEVQPSILSMNTVFAPFTSEETAQHNGELHRKLTVNSNVSTTLRAFASPVGSDAAAGSWFRSELLSEQIYLPKDYTPKFLTDCSAGASGNSDSSLTVNVHFSFEQASGAPAPRYQVYLMAMRAVPGDPLNGQYITVAQADADPITVNGPQDIVFTGLPLDFADNYDITTLTAAVLPEGSGNGPVYTWRPAAEEELPIGRVKDLMSKGWQIIAGADGSYTYRWSLPLMKADSSANTPRWKQNVGAKLSMLPRMAENDRPRIESYRITEEGKLIYTFAWGAVEGAQGYEVTLEGRMQTGDDAPWDTIFQTELAPDQRTLEQTADDWTFDYTQLRLTVTAQGGPTGAGGITLGRTEMTELQPVPRLPRMAEPTVTMAQDNTSFLYTISWTAPDGLEDEVAGYEVYADVHWTNQTKGQTTTTPRQTIRSVEGAQTSCTADLKAYAAYTSELQEKMVCTLDFYVMAVPKADSGYAAAARGGVLPVTIPGRETAPGITGVSLSYASRDGAVSSSDLYQGITAAITLSNQDETLLYDAYTCCYRSRQDLLDDLARKSTDPEWQPAAAAQYGLPLDNLRGTLQAGWEDAGSYVLLALRARSNTEVASEWVYWPAAADQSAGLLRLPAMRLDTPGAALSTLTLPHPITVTADGGATGMQDTMNVTLRTVAWELPQQTAGAQDSYQITLTHSYKKDAAGSPLTLTLTVKLHRSTGGDDPMADNAVERVYYVEDGQETDLVQMPDGSWRLQADTGAAAQWMETFRGLYSPQADVQRSFTMTVSPALAPVKDGENGITGYCLALPDVLAFDSSVISYTTDGSATPTTHFTDTAAVTALPGENAGETPALRSSDTALVTIGQTS